MTNARTDKIRLLIVDDSVFFRKALTEALASDPRIQVIGSAVDAMDAMEKIKALSRTSLPWMWKCPSSTASTSLSS